MGRPLKDHEIRNFANDLISEQFRFYVSRNQFPFSHSVDENSLYNRYGFATESTLSISRYLKFLAGALRDYFVPAFERAFPSAVKYEIHFLQYCLCFSDNVYYSFMLYSEHVRPKPSWPFTYFLVACAFIAEFALYCFQRMCYRFACTAKNCVLAVYYRYFREHLYAKEDLHLMSAICTYRMTATVRLSSLSPTHIFVNGSLYGNWDTFHSMVVHPVSKFLDIEIESIWEDDLLDEEIRYVMGGHLSENDRDSRLALCEFCGYCCITHLQLLLLFEFTFNE